MKLDGFVNPSSLRMELPFSHLPLAVECAVKSLWGGTVAGF